MGWMSSFIRRDAGELAVREYYKKVLTCLPGVRPLTGAGSVGNSILDYPVFSYGAMGNFTDNLLLGLLMISIPFYISPDSLKMSQVSVPFEIFLWKFYIVQNIMLENIP
jgi:hypothetical protein